jgi:plastocyanin
MVVALQLLAVTVSPVRADDSVPGSPDVTITLRNGVSDRDVSVPRGGIVRFVNRDDARHRMRSRSGDEFDTGNLEPGEAFQIRLSTAGTYTYIDEREDDDARYHGRILVTGGGSTASGGTNAGAGTTGGAPPKTATVTIGDRVFDPASTTVEVGGTVTFENADGDEHTATSAGGGSIDSGVLAPGASYKKTFSEAGRYDFLCMFHSDMRGTIEVVGGAAPAATPTPTPPPTPAPAPTEAPGAPATDSAGVDIVDLAFEPAAVEVVAGGSVTWTNTGDVPHTATAEDASFDSKALQSGATFTQTFATPGTFAYLCQIHPDMRGTVEVMEALAAAQAAQATAPPPPSLEAASPASAVDSPLTAGAIAAVALISMAVVMFAKVLAGTPRRVEEADRKAGLEVPSTQRDNR